MLADDNKNEETKSLSNKGAKLSKRFKCIYSNCKKSYSSKQRLKLHFNACHLGVGLRYTCQFCSFQASERYTLVTHMRKHNGDKPYQCQYCNKSFSIAGNKNDHEKRHIKLRPYSCAICGQQFYRNYVKENHEIKCRLKKKKKTFKIFNINKSKKTEGINLKDSLIDYRQEETLQQQSSQQVILDKNEEEKSNMQLVAWQDPGKFSIRPQSQQKKKQNRKYYQIDYKTSSQLNNHENQMIKGSQSLAIMAAQPQLCYIKGTPQHNNSHQVLPYQCGEKDQAKQGVKNCSVESKDDNLIINIAQIRENNSVNMSQIPQQQQQPLTQSLSNKYGQSYLKDILFQKVVEKYTYV